MGCLCEQRATTARATGHTFLPDARTRMPNTPLTDQKIGPGADAAGWSVVDKGSNRYHYISPDRTKYTCKRDAVAAYEASRGSRDGDGPPVPSADEVIGKAGRPRPPEAPATKFGIGTQRCGADRRSQWRVVFDGRTHTWQPLKPASADQRRSSGGGVVAEDIDEATMAHALKQQLGGRPIFLYGDSICEELGGQYFMKHDIPFEYADHGKMRGAPPVTINSQVSTPSHELTPDAREKLQRSSLVILSAGKNAMRDYLQRDIAVQIRDLVTPMLLEKPEGLPMLLLTPTKRQMVQDPDEIARHLKDWRVETDSFKLVTRQDVGLTEDDFRGNDTLHLAMSGMAKLVRGIQAKALTMPPAPQETAAQPKTPPQKVRKGSPGGRRLKASAAPPVPPPPQAPSAAAVAAAAESPAAESLSAQSIHDRVMAVRAAAEQEAAALASAEERRDKARAAAKEAAQTREGTTAAVRKAREELLVVQERDQAAAQAWESLNSHVTTCEQAVKDRADRKRKADDELLQLLKVQKLQEELDQLDQRRPTLLAQRDAALAALS